MNAQADLNSYCLHMPLTFICVLKVICKLVAASNTECSWRTQLCIRIFGQNIYSNELLYHVHVCTGMDALMDDLLYTSCSKYFSHIRMMER